MNALSSGSLLRTGSEIVINGLTHRLLVLGGDETALLPSARTADGLPLRAADLAGMTAALETLREVCQHVTLLNERLLDPLDGLTGRSLDVLMSSPHVDPAFRSALVPYAFAVFKHGCNVLTERGSVIVPPLPREAFARQVANLPAQQRGSIRWSAVLDHLFDPVPLVTQGFYLFERAEDRARFEASLGDRYAVACTALRRLFADAMDRQTDLPQSEWQRLDDLSQQVLDMQKSALEAALGQADPEVRRVAHRVRIRCYADGQIRMWSMPFALEFERELGECAALLRKARSTVPGFATQLRAVLLDLESWCLDHADSDDWAESRRSWLAADDPTNLVDVALTVEEKVSRLGAKGGFQMVVSAFDWPPEATKAVYEVVRSEGRRRGNLNVLFLRHMLVGGGASNATLAGEKLPDPDGRDLYKVMTFTNAVRGSMVRANASLILRATEWPESRLADLEDAASVLVLLHEFGHTFGDFAEFLGDIGASVEETNADASAIYQTKRLAPAHLSPLLHLAVGWMPVQRVLQGMTEAHSHADLVIFDTLRAEGAVDVVQLEDRWLVRVLSEEAAVRAAFALAIRMRLWEAGIPQRAQPELVEAFDAGDTSQDDRIAAAARRFVSGLSDHDRACMRRDVITECKAFFAVSRLRAVSEPLERVLACLPRYQSVAVIPTDRRLASLVAS